MMLDMPDTTTKLIDVGAVLQARVPSLKHYPAVLVRFLIWCLRTLVNEDRINQFFGLFHTSAIQNYCLPFIIEESSFEH